MKKKYVEPKIDEIKIVLEDVILVSMVENNEITSSGYDEEM